METIQYSKHDFGVGGWQEHGLSLPMKPVRHNGEVYDIEATLGGHGEGDVLEIYRRPGGGRRRYGEAVKSYNHDMKDAMAPTSSEATRTLAGTLKALERTRVRSRDDCIGGFVFAGTLTAITCVVSAGAALAVEGAIAGFFGAYAGLLGVSTAGVAVGSDAAGVKARAKGVVSKRTLEQLSGPWQGADGRSALLRLRTLETGLRNLGAVDQSPECYADKTIRSLPSVRDLQIEFRGMAQELRQRAEANRATAERLGASRATHAEAVGLRSTANVMNQQADAAEAIANDAPKIHDQLHAFQLDLERHVLKATLQDKYANREPPTRFEFTPQKPTLQRIA